MQSYTDILIEAVEDHNLNIVKECLSFYFNADPNVIVRNDMQGRRIYKPLLVYALSEMKDCPIEIIAELLKAGANPNSADHYMTALHYASNYHRLEVMKLLLDAGANPNIRNGHAQTVADQARYNEEKLQLLLRYGAKDLWGKLPSDDLAGYRDKLANEGRIKRN